MMGGPSAYDLSALHTSLPDQAPLHPLAAKPLPQTSAAPWASDFTQQQNNIQFTHHPLLAPIQQHDQHTAISSPTSIQTPSMRLFLCDMMFLENLIAVHRCYSMVSRCGRTGYSIQRDDVQSPRNLGGTRISGFTTGNHTINVQKCTIIAMSL